MKYDIYFKKSIVDYYNSIKKNKQMTKILFTTIASCFNISKSSIYSWINSNIGNDIPNLTEEFSIEDFIKHFTKILRKKKLERIIL